MKQRTHDSAPTRTTRRARGRALSLSLAAAALVLGTLFIHLASAGPAHEIELVYFNDAGQTIGGSIMTCNSGYHAWGDTSDYYAELITSCNPHGGSGHCTCTYQGRDHPCPTFFVCEPDGDL